MTARLHAQLAYLTARHTYRRMGQRHWFAGLDYPMNDNLFDASPSVWSHPGHATTAGRGLILGE
jgi:hypothetical protein